MKIINSIKDPLVLQARALSAARGRHEAQKCLLEGIEHVQWAVETGLPIEYLFVVDELKEDPLVVTLNRKGILCYLVSEGIAKKITETNYVISCIGVASVSNLFEV